MKTLTPREMYRAIAERDRSYEGLFVVAVKTTGIFCRPGCGARLPRPENVEFFRAATEALHAGYRPCKRCNPMGPRETEPEWVATAMALAERHSGRRLAAADLRAAGVDPVKAARYFKNRYGMTFQAYHRARRLGRAMRHLREGATAMRAGLEAGWESGSGFREAFAEVFGVAPSRAAGGRSGEEAVRMLSAAWVDSPVGPLLTVASERGVCMVEFVDRRALRAQIDTLKRRTPGVVAPGRNDHIDAVERELAEFFAGRRERFDVAIDAPGTEFQSRVWEALRRIPCGETRSYAQIARAIGAPTAVRAVARANGDNRIAIIIPCHRVIGADGTLTGYGGGLHRKQWLLDHERSMTGAHLLVAGGAAGAAEQA